MDASSSFGDPQWHYIINPETSDNYRIKGIAVTHRAASSRRAAGNAAIPAKVRRHWVAITAAAASGRTSRGMTEAQRVRSAPSVSTPPARVSSSPLSSEETHVSQQSSTATCDASCSILRARFLAPKPYAWTLYPSNITLFYFPV